MTKEKLDIIYEDKDIIVINKPAHLLTIATENEKSNTLYHKVHDYLYKKNKHNKVFIVHRLDKDTSGVILLAKSQDIKELLQAKWNELALRREYYAIVEGYVNNLKGEIVEYLKETNTLLTYASKDKTGKKAITKYQVVKRSKSHSILNISIETGRKNQIRVAMQNMGNPIIGDKKYGSTKNPLRRLCLHANLLEIKHPKTNKIMTFEARIPKEFDIFNK